MDQKEIEQMLKRPFKADEIEWRISRAGKKSDGKLWATCLAYVSNRAIMNRLDEVFGIGGWKNEYVAWKGDSQLCGISAKFDGIFSNNVLEHFPQPLESFQDMRSCLRPGGAMAHATPCYEWSYAHTRFHVFFPLGRSAAALAQRSGFHVATRIDDGELSAVSAHETD